MAIGGTYTEERRTSGPLPGGQGPASLDLGSAVVAGQDPAAEVPVSPMPSQNQADVVGAISRDSLAREVWEGHKAALEARYSLELIWQKLLLHIDGSGDFQWAEIWYDQEVVIPREVSEFRKTENLLRPIVDNAVAHHTTNPLRYLAESGPDSQSSERALIDTLWMNHLAEQQDLNGLFAQAMYLAMPCGFSPVHRYWREDAKEDWFESLGEIHSGDPMVELEQIIEQMMQGYQPTPGMIDCFVGNPFGTVFDSGAKRGSVSWCSYERVFRGDVIREKFDHLPQARGLEGAKRMPSSSEFQMIAQSWRMTELGIHGDPTMNARRKDGEDLVTVICREMAPGADARWPEGRLQMIALPGEQNLRSGNKTATPILLVDQPLPAGDFSWTLFYSHHRGTDIYGKPWAEDLDYHQVDLNIGKSKRHEQVQRMADAPIVGPGAAMHEDMRNLDGFNYLGIEEGYGNWRPQVMEWPSSILQALDNEVEEARQAMFRIGGYQAASRGESPGSRTPYRAILAMQQADNTIHGPVNQQFKRSAAEFARGSWRQMKTYGDVPWIISITGDEFAHLAEPYIDKTQLSDRPPRYKLVNAFGPTPEMQAQEILELMQTKGADGEPFLSTDEARRNYPNGQLFANLSDPRAVRRKRARAVSVGIRQKARDFRKRLQFQEEDRRHPWMQQAAVQVFQEIEAEFPRDRADDLEAHINALSEITQDPTADPLAQEAAKIRRELYYQWQASMAAPPGMAPGGPGGSRPGGGPRGPAPGMQQVGPGRQDPRTVQAERQGGGSPGGSRTLQDEGEESQRPVMAGNTG